MGEAAAELVLADAVAAFAHDLGNHLIAAFALGSLAHGGFSALVSDVDIGLVLTDESGASDAEVIESITGEVRGRGTELHRRLSVFWATLSTLQDGSEGGRFPPLDRLDLIEHGRLLTGNDSRILMARPRPTELFVAGAEFALDFLAGEQDVHAPGLARLGSMSPGEDSVTEQLRDPALLVAQGPRRLTKLVLFPVRFLFTAETSQVGTNALAVEHFLADADAPAKELVAAAIGWRFTAPEDAAEAEALLGRGMIPLYRYLIEDHLERLVGMGQRELADRYEKWQARLVA
jgi:hypothetical protein